MVTSTTSLGPTRFGGSGLPVRTFALRRMAEELEIRLQGVSKAGRTYLAGSDIPSYGKEGRGGFGGEHKEIPPHPPPCGVETPVFPDGHV